MDNLKIANIQLKEYQIGLEEQILKMNEEIESLVSHNNPSESRVSQSPEKSAFSFEERKTVAQGEIAGKGVGREENLRTAAGREDPE